MNEHAAADTLTAADFATDQEVRWCPGCGDYAVLKAVRTVLADIGARRENTVFVSGIGCSSRFPYYIDTYGFHTIHGRAPAVATGMLLANPDLDVWIITGDGDGLSIGGNHLLHILRRNLNCQILLFNNETYGLTKGQFSPTSHLATRTPSSPSGSIDNPVDPARFALGCGARFVARGVDTQIKQLIDVLKAAYHHKGAAFVEIFQNCIVFNEDVFEGFTAKANVAEHQLQAEHGKPLTFGTDGSRGLAFDPQSLGLKTIEGSNGEQPLIHDASNHNLASALARMENPDFPMATGVLYDNPGPVYRSAAANVSDGGERRKLMDVMRAGLSWHVDKTRA